MFVVVFLGRGEGLFYASHVVSFADIIKDNSLKKPHTPSRYPHEHFPLNFNDDEINIVTDTLA